MSETDAQILNRGSVENIDQFAYAPPGHSLTQDNSRWPWGKPPRDADPEAALERAIAGLKKPKVRGELMKLLMVGVSVIEWPRTCLHQRLQSEPQIPSGTV